MGDFIFAKDFGMLATEEWHVIVVKLRRALSLLGPLSSVPWLAHIAFRFIPGIWVVKDWFAMMKWCHAQMDERVKVMLPLPCTCQSESSRSLLTAANRWRRIGPTWLNG